MTLVTPSLVFCKVSIVSTSILMLPTWLLTTAVWHKVLTSTTSSVIRVLLLMTQVCSIAHMFLSRWFVPSVRTPSNQKSDSRPATVSSRTPSQKEPSKVWDASWSTRTATIVALLSRTSCDPFGSHRSSEGGLRTPSFFI